MLSSNSSSCCNQESNLNYTQFFPENDVAFSLFEYQDFYLQFLDLFSHHQQTAAAATMAAGSNQNDVVQAAVRSSKKDRHSKITTARGPRDRRMRLSLEIARKFFDLQDLHGYDKASRTVEWLLRNSGAAIDELARARNASSDQSSTCEEAVAAAACGKSRKRREKVKREVGRARVGREERRKARERARERTSQKKRLTSSSKEAYVSDVAYDMRPWNPSDAFNYQEENAVFLNNQEEQVVEFELSGKPWEAFNSFNLSG